MNRIDSMSRFAEPEEVKPVCACDWCGTDLYEGSEVFTVNGDTYCEAECVANAYCARETL